MFDFEFDKNFALILIILSEVILVKVNYEARVVYKEHFVEGTGIWRFFDKLNWKIGFFLHELCVAVICGAMYLFSSPTLYVILGIILTNTYFDVLTFEHKIKCVLSGCEFTKLRDSQCIPCQTHEKYKLKGLLKYSLEENKPSRIKKFVENLLRGKET